MKTRNKLLLIILIILAVVIVIKIIIDSTQAQIKYEYFVNDKFYESNDCYQTEDVICYCKDNNGKYIKVDSYSY